MSDRKRAWLWFAGGCAATVVLALVVGIIGLRVTFKNYRQRAASMEPTIAKGDRVIARRAREIERGDVLVFHSPIGGGRMIKRVIGLPGDVVELRNSGAIVNGIALHEPYIKRDPDVPAIRDFPSITVPPDSYFMLGDNRDNSNDSRFLGYANRADIMGKAVMIVSEKDGIVMLP
jgi:signal peptidase I